MKKNKDLTYSFSLFDDADRIFLDWPESTEGSFDIFRAALPIGSSIPSRPKKPYRKRVSTNHFADNDVHRGRTYWYWIRRSAEGNLPENFGETAMN